MGPPIPGWPVTITPDVSDVKSLQKRTIHGIAFVSHDHPALRVLEKTQHVPHRVPSDLDGTGFLIVESPALGVVQLLPQEHSSRPRAVPTTLYRTVPGGPEAGGTA